MALTEIEIRSIQNAKQNIKDLQKKIHTLQKYIEVMEEKCEHNFSRLGPLESCCYCGLTTKY